MKVSITEFRDCAYDGLGNALPLGRNRTACQVITAAGAASALSDDTRFVRIATDTAIHIDIAGGATGATDELFPANIVEYLAVNGGETFTIAAA